MEEKLSSTLHTAEFFAKFMTNFYPVNIFPAVCFREIFFFFDTQTEVRLVAVCSGNSFVQFRGWMERQALAGGREKKLKSCGI